MEFSELLVNRRSIRQFEDKDVPVEVIKEIINDSIKAPNASNKQVWNFIIVKNKEYMQKLSDISRQGFIDSVERNPDSPLKEYATGLKERKNVNFFFDAPCLVYITGPTNVGTIREDVGLLAAYFMFSATERGLGTCWIGMGGGVRDKAVLAEMGLPKGHHLIAPIIIGYPKDGKIPPMRKRNEPTILKIIE
ncbi:MAG: nitroreductase family protein [Proteobacteria bacterium]|nr:nitroreductase family protein [Pseudomonadota bacterium]